MLPCLGDPRVTFLDARNKEPHPTETLDEGTVGEKVPGMGEAVQLHKHVDVLRLSHLWLDHSAHGRNVAENTWHISTGDAVGMQLLRIDAAI